LLTDKLRVLALFSVTFTFLPAAHTWAQGCGPCAPSVGSLMSGGTRTVYIGDSITGDDRVDVESAFGAVGWAFSGLRGMIDEFVFVNDPQGADLQVHSVPLAGGIGGSAAHGGNARGYIRLNSEYVNRNDRPIVWNIATHEIMHTMGFSDNYDPGCRTSTAMAQLVDGGPYANGPSGTDICSADQAWGGNESPIIISLSCNRPRLSSLDGGVLFDIRNAGVLDQVAWPVDGVSGFLALDRNGNGQIDSGAELFGNHTPLQAGGTSENGYEALKEFDVDGDEWIESDDTVYGLLRLWIDRNRDGVSQPDELHGLEGVGIIALSLRYESSRYTDRWGNDFRYHAPVISRARVGPRLSWDVFLRNRRGF
jgi:hypothetical protein